MALKEDYAGNCKKEVVRIQKELGKLVSELEEKKKNLETDNLIENNKLVDQIDGFIKRLNDEIDDGNTVINQLYS